MKNKKLINSFKYAFKGIGSAFLTERNMKIHVTMMILVIICGIIFKISVLEWFICIACFGIVIGGEMFNTAIEQVVNIAMPEKDPRAKLAKDVSAGGVLVLALAAATIGLIIFVPKALKLLEGIL
ncbi:MAG TPA: diacylglycerol kinase family protein [Candidatus Onthocola stercoravium]|nr:diacylglycerol kinase family protein [Candidatus Onthocola stercoravium]